MVILTTHDIYKLSRRSFLTKKKHMEALIKFSFQIEYFTGQPSRQGFGVAGIYGMYSIPAVR